MLSRPTEWTWATANRVAAYTPAGSEINREAVAFASDPSDYVRSRTIRDFEASAALVRAGRRWEGEWSFELLSVPPLAGNDVRQALNDFKGKAGSVLFTVETYDSATYRFTGTFAEVGGSRRTRPATGFVIARGFLLRTPQTGRRSVVPVLDPLSAAVAFKMDREGGDLAGTGDALEDAYSKNYYYRLGVTQLVFWVT